VIKRLPLKQFAECHPSAYGPLDQWYRITRKADWANLVEVQADFNHAEAVGGLTVFNIKGNQFRLICRINYRTKKVFVRHVLTHKEYDKGAWKE
jgi:mRNA interferase HigB